MFPRTASEARENGQLQPGRERLAEAWDSVFGMKDESWGETLGTDLGPARIIGALCFENTLSYKAIRQRIAERLLAIPRFRSRLERVKDVSERGLQLKFVEMDLKDIDLDYHLEQVEQDEPWSREELHEFIDTKTGHLRFGVPRWKMYIIPQMENGTSVLLADVYHSIGDGTSLITVLTQVLADEQGVEQFDNMSKEDAMLYSGRAIPRRPLPELGWFEKVRAIATGTLSPFLSAILPGDPPSSLKLSDPKTVSVCKSTYWSDHVDLLVLKKLKEKNPGSTINDVMVSIMTVMYRLYYVEHNDAILEYNKPITAIFPKDMREPGTEVLTEESFGNHFGAMMCDLDIHQTDPKKLILETSEKLSKLKYSPEGIIRGMLVKLAVRFMPHNMDTVGSLSDGLESFTGSISNVRGPEKHFYVCGNKVVDMGFSLAQEAGSTIGLLSYAGRVSASVSTDPKQVDKESKNLAKHFIPAVRVLCNAHDVRFPDACGGETIPSLECGKVTQTGDRSIPKVHPNFGKLTHRHAKK